jgi:hypothetical protein
MLRSKGTEKVSIRFTILHIHQKIQENESKIEHMSPFCVSVAENVVDLQNDLIVLHKHAMKLVIPM